MMSLMLNGPCLFRPSESYLIRTYIVDAYARETSIYKSWKLLKKNNVPSMMSTSPRNENVEIGSSYLRNGKS